MRNKLLNLIRKNRISSVEVADALDKQGVIDGLASLNPGNYVAGEIWYAATWGNSNWPLHEQLQSMPTDVVVFIEGIDCEGRALIGDLVAKTTCLYGGALGILVEGLVRDAHRLRKENYPIWCKGSSPLGCFNNDVPITPDLKNYINERRNELNGALVVADDSGYSIIEKSRQTQELFDKLEFIELQEDIWYFCIDTLKLSTYDTICNKVYLDKPEILPENMKQKLKKYYDKYK